MTKYPKGAIRSRAEFEALSKRALKEGKIPIYPVIEDRGNNLEILLRRVWDVQSCLNSGYANYTDDTDGTGCHLELKEILGGGPRRLFTNYWHAWAYVQRLQNQTLTK